MLSLWPPQKETQSPPSRPLRADPCRSNFISVGAEQQLHPIIAHFDNDQGHTNRACKWFANKRTGIGILDFFFNDRVLDQQGGEQRKSMNQLVWPQYLVEPRHVEGSIPDSGRLYYFVSGRTILISSSMISTRFLSVDTFFLISISSD